MASGACKNARVHTNSIVALHHRLSVKSWSSSPNRNDGNIQNMIHELSRGQVQKREC